MTHLRNTEISELAQIAVAENIDQIRNTLFPAPHMSQVRAALNIFPNPLAQMTADLQQMNTITRTPSGIVPLERWLTYVSPYIKDAGHKKIIDDALTKISTKSDGAPQVPDTAVTNEIKEKIIQSDDLVPFGYLEGGATAGVAVGRIKVYPFENGAQKLINGTHSPHLGTGWLLSKSLVMTNHHVANARSKKHIGDPMPIASDVDLKMQAEHSVVEWDYLDENIEPVQKKITGIRAWDVDLDYAIFELEQSSSRRPLPLIGEDIDVASLDDRVPVNIIQHPGGDVKKAGLRNNLVLQTTDDEIHYFTDTRRGSSGSPVMDDAWQVIGLHKATRRVDDVKYQGKTTAYINVGTKIRKIVDHATDNFPDVVPKLPG